ncbi:MAG: hypothetical protein GY749_44080 [Desulfobacteraceae bacterium]|nr:hypothetical protein [Desulfobacteraceae bacterium]
MQHFKINISADRTVRSINMLLAAIFFFIITFPSVIWIAVDDKIISATEKRKLKQLPDFPLTADALKKYPGEFDVYFMDQFGLRDKLYYLYDIIMVNLGVSPSYKIMLGKNGWLFLDDVGVIDDYRNVRSFTPEELETFKACLESKYYRLKKQNIKYLFVIVPNKHTIYSEHLPSGIKKLGNKSKYDQFTEYMQNSAVPVIDLRPALISAKEKYRIYHKTDTHWNSLGADIAQYEIVRFINTVWPDIEPYPARAGKITWKEGKGGDLANVMGLSGYFKELRPETNMPDSLKKKNSKRLLIFGDSFSNALIPYLSHYFSYSNRILKYANQSLLEKYVKAEYPDIVIEESIERHLKLFPEYCN